MQNERGAQVALELLPICHQAVDLVRRLVLSNAEGVLCVNVIHQGAITQEDFITL